MLGVGEHLAPINLASGDLLRGRNVCGSLFGGLKPKLDIPILVDYYLKKVHVYVSSIYLTTIFVRYVFMEFTNPFTNAGA